MNSLPADFQFSFTLCLGFVLLAPFAIAGVALINAGLGRSRSAVTNLLRLRELAKGMVTANRS